MPWKMKYTSKKDTWGGSVKEGESFTIEQYTNGVSHRELKQHLEKIGRKVVNYSESSGGSLDVGEVREINEWIIERVS